MRLNWRAWQALAGHRAVEAGQSVKPKPIPKKVLKKVKPKLRNPHTDGPHSVN
jgi:hypothetical protein